MLGILVALIGASFCRATEKSLLIEEKKVAEESEPRLKLDHEQQLSADLPAVVELGLHLRCSRLTCFRSTQIDTALVDCDQPRGPPAC
jgi:hypothetical protein